MEDYIDDELTEIIDALAGCAREIEQIFTRAGEQLGEGMTLFETLKAGFGALSDALAGADMETTRDSLRRLAGQLRAFESGLPAETAALETIATRNTEASQSLGRLRDHLQLIAILAQSTRIEAASAPSHQGELRVFTDRIVGLTRQAKLTVDGCARDHERLTVLLSNALTRQRDFVARYRDELTSTAGRLERSIVGLGDQVARSVASTADAAERSAGISMAVGGAVIAAQSGDSIRQRLEHCVTALRLAARVIAEAGGGETGTSEDQSRIEVVLKRLQSAQSRAAAVVLIAEVGQIDSALAALANDTEALVQFGRALHGGEGASTRSFLEGLEAELAEASGLLQKCDAARGGVDSATEALTTLLIQFQQTVAGLSETIEDIVMIGTNAGLLAARLGSDGRGLVVIAGEVKSVAAHIATDATRLNPIFTSMRDASRDLRDRDHRGAAEMADLDRAMRLSLEQMRGSATRLGATLDRLARDGARFADVVDECRRMFASAAAAGETIEDAADALDPAASKRRLVADGDSAAIEDALRRQVWPTYTMSAERQIYREILREFGLESVGAAEAA